MLKTLVKYVNKIHKQIELFIRVANQSQMEMLELRTEMKNAFYGLRID
jgi:hypothetical protein